jgi:hypothetical protein
LAPPPPLQSVSSIGEKTEKERQLAFGWGVGGGRAKSYFGEKASFFIIHSYSVVSAHVRKLSKLRPRPNNTKKE